MQENYLKKKQSRYTSLRPQFHGNKNMFHFLIAICLVFFTSNAQEHLTCLRTDDVINPSAISRPANVQQGRPGRHGPPGPKGERGLSVKGEPGIPDNSLINSLEGIFV